MQSPRPCPQPQRRTVLRAHANPSPGCRREAVCAEAMAFSSGDMAGGGVGQKGTSATHSKRKTAKGKTTRRAIDKATRRGSSEHPQAVRAFEGISAPAKVACIQHGQDRMPAAPVATHTRINAEGPHAAAFPLVGPRKAVVIPLLSTDASAGIHKRVALLASLQQVRNFSSAAEAMWKRTPLARHNVAKQNAEEGDK